MERKALNNPFGFSVCAALDKAEMSQADLARSTQQSASYVSHILTGRKPPSAEWVELIADALNLSSSQRAELHYKAAIRNGFKL